MHPSLRPAEALRLIPELDSLVRFKGERTLLELVECLGEGRDRHEVMGLAWREGGHVARSPMRPPTGTRRPAPTSEGGGAGAACDGFETALARLRDAFVLRRQGELLEVLATRSIGAEG